MHAGIHINKHFGHKYWSNVKWHAHILHILQMKSSCKGTKERFPSVFPKLPVILSVRRVQPFMQQMACHPTVWLTSTETPGSAATKVHSLHQSPFRTSLLFWPKRLQPNNKCLSDIICLTPTSRAYPGVGGVPRVWGSWSWQGQTGSKAAARSWEFYGHLKCSRMQRESFTSDGESEELQGRRAGIWPTERLLTQTWNAGVR